MLFYTHFVLQTKTTIKNTCYLWFIFSMQNYFENSCFKDTKNLSTCWGTRLYSLVLRNICQLCYRFFWSCPAVTHSILSKIFSYNFNKNSSLRHILLSKIYLYLAFNISFDTKQFLHLFIHF